MNKVLIAKDEIEVARGNLLSFSQQQFDVFIFVAYFMGASISCLVPFLFPSNWYDFYAAEGTHIMRKSKDTSS